jgi:hypothetical protein
MVRSNGADALSVSTVPAAHSRAGLAVIDALENAATLRIAVAMLAIRNANARRVETGARVVARIVATGAAGIAEANLGGGIHADSRSAKALGAATTTITTGPVGPWTIFALTGVGIAADQSIAPTSHRSAESVEAGRADALLAGGWLSAEIYRTIRSTRGVVGDRCGLATPGQRVADAGGACVAGAVTVGTTAGVDDRPRRQIA